MKKVCVITGGGSGRGLATAKLVCEEGYYTILVGRTASKLEKAVNDLRRAGAVSYTHLTLPTICSV